MTDLPPGAPTEVVVHKPRVSEGTQILLVWIVAVTMIVAVISGAFVNWNQSQINLSQQQQIAQLSANNDALREQVLAQGETPVAPPAEAVTGAKGDPGTTGANGRDGRSVSGFVCQADSTWLVLYDDSTRQTLTGPCIGATGSPGIGIDGKDGTNGVDGAPGPAGAPGEPVYSWTWVTSLGTTRECVRDDPFDPARPSYHCQTITP